MTSKENQEKLASLKIRLAALNREKEALELLGHQMNEWTAQLDAIGTGGTWRQYSELLESFPEDAKEHVASNYHYLSGFIAALQNGERAGHGGK